MIGLLNAYHFDLSPDTYQKDYAPMCMQYLKKILPEEEIKSYLVAQGVFPQEIDECTGYIITGSPASSYDQEPWIQQLEEFIQRCHTKKKKVLGICFGHQIIAQALGGEVEKSSKGWGVGVKTATLVSSTPWITLSQGQSFSMLYSHQDQVSKMPPEAKLVATSDFCSINAYCIGEHIFSIQGHPEFTRTYAKNRYDARKDLLGSEIYTGAAASLQNSTDEELIGKWILNFFSA